MFKRTNKALDRLAAQCAAIRAKRIAPQSVTVKELDLRESSPSVRNAS